MTNTAFDWQIDEFMIYCRSRQLREKTMLSYEQTLRLFERWCKEQLNIVEVDKVTESVVRCYINDLQERGKYSFYSNDNQKQTNFPERRRDYRKPISIPLCDRCAVALQEPLDKGNVIAVLLINPCGVFKVSSSCFIIRKEYSGNFQQCSLPGKEYCAYSNSVH